MNVDIRMPNKHGVSTAYLAGALIVVGNDDDVKESHHSSFVKQMQLVSTQDDICEDMPKQDTDRPRG
jgi:hypothetical protein